MKPQELDQLFQNNFNCYGEPFDDFIMAMSRNKFLLIVTKITNLNAIQAAELFQENADCQTTYIVGNGINDTYCQEPAISKDKFIAVLAELFEKEPK